MRKTVGRLRIYRLEAFFFQPFLRFLFVVFFWACFFEFDGKHALSMIEVDTSLLKA